MITLNKFLNFVLKPFKEHSFGPLAALGVGAATGLVGGLIGAKGQKDAAKIAAAAAQFRKLGTESGVGTTGFDGDVLTQQLSPEYQALRDQLLAQGAQGLQQFQTFDPTEAGQLFSQQLGALAAPQEKQQRLALENRLFQQGLTGASGGQQRTEALLGAQALAAGQRDLTGLQLGQQQQGRLFEQALGGIQGATTLDQLLQNQQSQAISAGGAQTTAATNAAQFQFQASQNRGDAISGFFGNLGQGLSNLAFQPQAQVPQFGYEQAFNFQGNLPGGPQAFGPQ